MFYGLIQITKEKGGKLISKEVLVTYMALVSLISFLKGTISTSYAGRIRLLRKDTNFFMKDH
jgi:hypothetical protein